jgi:predicted permease
MFWKSFRATQPALLEIFLLGLVGYLLVKRNVLSEDGLNNLSRLVVEVTLPALIFYQLLRDFSFSAYPRWWIWPLVSAAITLAGLLLGACLSYFIKGRQHRLQFLSLVGFQNSGYLPLALISALLPSEKAGPMLIYLFLFLLGFNLVIWSVGVHLLSLHTTRKFELGSVFSPPAIACLLSLAAVFFGLNRLVPQVVFKALRMAGDCTMPLALFVVGASLAEIRLHNIDIKANILLILAKLFILPALGLWLIAWLKLPEAAGLLILMQLAVPSATSLAVITRHYRKEDLLVSQGIFVSHIAGLLSVPVFLSLYYWLIVVK